ncbi:hypothetical protein ACIRFH_29975 [Streptomyces sp. NPDC093586]
MNGAHTALDELHPDVVERAEQRERTRPDERGPGERANGHG